VSGRAASLDPPHSATRLPTQQQRTRTEGSIGSVPLQPIRRILVTGASGHVAGLVLPVLRAAGLEIAPLDRAEGADLADPFVADSAVRGQQAILHLAGMPGEASVDALYRDNTLALSNLLQASARANLRRFVFASSMHVLGLYARDAVVDENSPARPDSHYAASKVHGEALCRLYADKAGLQVTTIRLGHVAATLEEAEPACWISPEDVAQLVAIALTRTGPAYEVFHAVADYRGAPSSGDRARAYGYQCRRPAEPFDAALLRLAAWTQQHAARELRGATFAAAPVTRPG
jgi:uronate dehydrogenase